MTSRLNSEMLKSLQQTETPLNSLYFSDFNLNLLQKAIREKFKKLSGGISIDYQDPSDLLTIMRAVFVDNSSDPYGDVCGQVRQMNEVVIKTALNQINTGVSQYMGYIKDIETPIQPLDQPINTSTYGNKIDSMNIGV